MPTTDAAFIAKIREQVEFLRHEEYAYHELRVYVSGIAKPWVFGAGRRVRVRRRRGAGCADRTDG